VIADLKKELEELKKLAVAKDNTNSSIPASKDCIPRTRSQRKKSGKKSGGQPGHRGHHREYNRNTDKLVLIQDEHCAGCGASLCEVEGSVERRAQEVDLPVMLFLVVFEPIT